MANHELMKLTANRFKEGGYDKVVLAVGSCEAHGAHLAEGCDTIVSQTLSKLVADRVKGLLVLPPITYGYSGHYDSFPFTLTLNYDTVTAVVYDVLESVLRNGINKISISVGERSKSELRTTACALGLAIIAGLIGYGLASLGLK